MCDIWHLNTTATVVGTGTPVVELEDGAKYVIYYYSGNGTGYALTTDLNVENVSIDINNQKVSSEAANIGWSLEKDNNNLKFYYTGSNGTKQYLSMEKRSNGHTLRLDANQNTWTYNTTSHTLHNTGRDRDLRCYYSQNGIGFGGGDYYYYSTTIYLAKYIPPVYSIKVHYVDENGQEIAGHSEITLPPSEYSDYLHLTDIAIKIPGYTYHDTYIGDGDDFKAIHIIPELKGVDGGGYAYQVYGGTEREKIGSNWEVPFNTITEDTDIYVVYGDPYAISGGATSSDPENPSINEPKTSKDVSDNHDGTYTLSLSITGESASKDDTKGANVILVMDTSNSMRDNYATGQLENGTTSSQRRLYWAKQSAKSVAKTLLELNTSKELVEMALISFDYNVSPEGDVTWYTEYEDNTGLAKAISDLSTNSGTNWEAALQKAKAIADAKVEAEKAANEGKFDDTYIIFITDGNPSARIDTQKDQVNGNHTYAGEATAADGDVNKTNQGTYNYYRRSENYMRATDDARSIVQSGYGFYSVGIYGNVDVLKNLTNFAYTGRSNGNEVDAGHYFPAASTDDMNKALGSIAEVISMSVSVAGAAFEDGIATDVAATTLSATSSGTATGVTYSKIGGTTPSYTVKVGSDGKPQFAINGGTPVTGTTKTIAYDKIVKNTTTGVIETTPANAEVFYYKDTDEKEYIMSIATFGDDDQLDWDLSPLGTLEGGATYKISMIMWPNQDAYDYVANLNNNIEGFTWNEETQEAVYSSKGEFLYWKKGVTGYENIVKYEDGHFAALTNTSQNVSYYIVNKDGDDVSYTEGSPKPLETPTPMQLTDTTTKITKKWESALALRQLARFLYYTEDTVDGDGVTHKAGESRKVSIGFNVSKDKDHYTTVSLGWNEKTQEYEWADANLTPPKSTSTVVENGKPYEVGAYWQSDFDISIGILLTTDRMNALGLEKTKYASFDYGGKTYYVLETGHDYKVSEPVLSYSFDFVNKQYHPMYVDGTLSNVTFSESGTTITAIESIETMDRDTGIMVWNYLRGGINLDKNILDPGNNAIENDVEFPFSISLTNAEGLLKGDSVPWYSVNGYYYHNDEGDYISEEEAKTLYPDTYAQHGNILNALADGTAASANIMLTSKDSLRIGNVPIGTNYEISETEVNGYTLKSITKEIYLSASEHPISTQGIHTDTRSVDGEIVPNRENNLTFTNQMVDYPAFYVYHSKNGSIEKIFVKDDPRVTAQYNSTTKTYDISGFNIVKETLADTLYGGYYKVYSGSSLKDTEIAALTYTKDTSVTGIATAYDGNHKGGSWAVDENCTPYVYANIKNIGTTKAEGKVSWQWNDAYTTQPGTSINPTVDTIYYLKEVPNYYLTNYVYAIYNRSTKAIETLYEMTAIDDVNYNSFALDGTKATMPGTTGVTNPVLTGNKFVRAITFSSFTHDDEDGAVYGELKTASDTYLVEKGATTDGSGDLHGENVFSPEGIKEGYLAYWQWDVNDKVYPLSICPVWETPDGVFVHGIYSGPLSIPTNDASEYIVDGMSLGKE